MATYVIERASDDCQLTPEMSTFFDQLMTNDNLAINKILNSTHYKLLIDKLDTNLVLLIRVDLRDHSDYTTIYKLLKEMKRTELKPDQCESCAFTCGTKHSTGCYLTSSYERGDNYKYINSKRIYTHEYTLATIYIANCDIIENISKINMLIKMLSNYW